MWGWQQAEQRGGGWSKVLRRAQPTEGQGNDRQEESKRTEQGRKACLQGRGSKEVDGGRASSLKVHGMAVPGD